MKILFWGSTQYNNGPDNVNKQYISNLSNKFFFSRSKNTIFPSLKDIGCLLNCDVVVVSGLSKKGYIIEFLTKLMQKKLIYIMHGYYKHEVEINRIKRPGFGILHESFLLKTANLILPVSSKYMVMMMELCPEYAHKIRYLHNGIDIDELRYMVPRKKNSGTVAAAGGMSRIKNNITTARAIESFGGKLKLTIYGDNLNVPLEEKYQHTRFAGKYPHDKFLEELNKTEIYVVNSVCESFNVSVIEALFCGCSILVSKVAGVTDLLTLEESDIIHNPMDVEEIKRKLLHLLNHPNNERIRASLDVEEYSYPRQVQKLEQMCRELIQQ